MKRSVIALVVAVAVPLASCQLFRPYPAAQRHVMDAAARVLGRHFAITDYSLARGTVVGVSAEGANLAARYRTLATATVYPVGSGKYDCQIRVENQLESSLPSAMGGAQPPYQWSTAGFDRVLEARLMNELRAELAYHVGSVAAPTSSYAMFRPLAKPTARHRDLFPAPAPPPPAPKPTSSAPHKPRAAPKGAQALARPDEPARVEGYAQHLAQGDLHLRRGEHDQALQEYQCAALARPHAASAYLSLASVWTAIGHYAAGAESLRLAAGASGERALTAREVARLRYATGDVSQRLLLLQGRCKQDAGDTDARLLLGYHCLLADRAQDARAALEQVLRAHPQDPAARYLVGQLDARRS